MLVRSFRGTSSSSLRGILVCEDEAGQGTKGSQGVFGIDTSSVIVFGSPAVQQVVLDFAVSLEGTLRNVYLGRRSFLYVSPGHVGDKGETSNGVIKVSDQRGSV